MAQHDVDFDVAAARNWKLEVEMELDQVNHTLSEVTEIGSTIPGEDDSIMNGFKSVAQMMDDAWTAMCNGFSEMCNFFENLINDREKSINKITDSIESYGNDFRL